MFEKQITMTRCNELIPPIVLSVKETVTKTKTRPFYPKVLADDFDRTEPYFFTPPSSPLARDASSGGGDFSVRFFDLPEAPKAVGLAA